MVNFNFLSNQIIKKNNHTLIELLRLKFGLKGPRIFSEARQASCTHSLTISGSGTPPTRAAAAIVPAL